MKLSIAQALGTVLNIQIDSIPNKETGGVDDWYMLRRHATVDSEEFDLGIGKVSEMTLDQAVWKAAEMTSFSSECHFAIFPMGSGREDYYMAVEREMLRQEADPSFEGKKMWQLLGNDPRDLVTATMEQLRECAVSLIQPHQFQSSLLRVAVLLIACLQWTNDWLGRLRVRNAHLHAQIHSEIPKVVPGLAKPDPTVRGPAAEPGSIPPLFGNPTLSIVEPTPEAEVSEEKGSVEVVEIDGGEDAPNLRLRVERGPKKGKEE